MNRKIKFRAWDKELKGMMKWEDEKESICDAIPYDNGDEWTERCTVMQYIGLKDKNGKEIYEGDILQVESADREIIKVVCKFGIARRFMDTGCGVDIPSFYFERTDGLKSFPIVNNWNNKHDLEMLEIIGNIFENEELLWVKIL